MGKSDLRMLRHREEMFPRPSEAGGEQEDQNILQMFVPGWAPTGPQSTAKGTARPWQCL